MKNYLTLIAIGWLMNLSIFAYAQSPFSKVLYDSLKNGIYGNTLLKTFDNGYLITGSSYDYALAIKIDSTGNFLWNKEIGQSLGDAFLCAVTTNDSGLLLGGSTYDTSLKLSEALCVKLNSNGDTIWTREIGQQYYNTNITSIQQTKDSGNILTGVSSSQREENTGIFTVKLDSKGNIQWSNFILIGPYISGNCIVKQTPDGGYLVCGGYFSDNPLYQAFAFLLKLDPNGDVSWANKYYNSEKTSSGIDVQITNNGFLYLLSAGLDLVFMRTDLFGNIVSYKSLVGFNNPNLNLNRTNDNGYIFASEQIVFKTDSVGDFLWGHEINLSGNEGVTESNDKGFLIYGGGPIYGVTPLGYPPPSPQIGIMKTDSMGNGGDCIYPIFTGSFVGDDTLFYSPTNFINFAGGTTLSAHLSINSILLNSDTGCIGFLGGIHQINSNNGLSVYPNPSTGSFTLTSVNTIVRGTVEIYNMVGEKIFEENIFNTSKEEINLHNVAPGIYIVKVTDGNKEGIQKLIIQ